MSDDLKKLPVSALRELARKHLGKGYSRLRTKADLLEALARAMSTAALPGEPSPGASVAASRSASEAAAALPSVRPALVTRFHKPRAVNGAAGPSSAGNGALAATHTPSPSPTPPVEPQPVVEGFFVVRVAGPAEAERHHLTESSGAPRPAALPSPGYDEQLGELPDVYEDDAELLLPRNPHTLFFMWDFARDTRQGALAGIHNPRARLRVYDPSGQMVRELDFALESKSYYVHRLTPGQSYRVEACFVGEGGEVRRLGRGSNVIALPSEGPSANLEVRFMRVPWEIPLSRIKELLRQARAAQERVASPARLPLPSSQSSRGLVAGEGEGSGVPGSRWAPSQSGRP